MKGILSQRISKCLALLILLSSYSAWAGFLEMPDTTEVPEMERESMLKDLDIPSVRERDPDPMAGPRLNVTEFRVQGIVEFPELGITRESLNKLVESIRFDMMGEGEMLESGYTLDEVSEISDLIAEIEEETSDTSVGPLELQRLVFLIREQRRNRGVTLGMIETVADTITRYYRERGFFLAKAYIPEQRVRDGIVTLTLLLGNLGEVQVLNNKRYKTSTLERVLKPIVGDPVYAKNIEERLYFINDMPGMSAQAYFEPGKQVGDTKLNINVLNERRFKGNVRLDNHGSSSTGEFRTYTDGYWLNPGGYGDQLHIGVLATMNPSNSLYGSLHYGMPLFSPRAKFTIGGSTNDFISKDIDRFDITGSSQVLDFSLNYILKRSRVKNYSVELRGSNIKTTIEQNAGGQGGSSDATVQEGDITENNSLDLVYNFDVLAEAKRSLHQGGVRLTYIDVVDPGYEEQNEAPLILAMNYSWLKFVKVPFTKAQSRVLLKANLQFAEERLPSTAQFSAAGPNRMRALEINHFSGDKGAYFAADWIFNGLKFVPGKLNGEKISSLLQPYIFAEATQVEAIPISSNNPLSNSFKATDIGLGLNFNYKNIRSGIKYAKITSYELDNGNNQVVTEPKWSEHVYADFQYSF